MKYRIFPLMLSVLLMTLVACSDEKEDAAKQASNTAPSQTATNKTSPTDEAANQTTDTKAEPSGYAEQESDVDMKGVEETDEDDAERDHILTLFEKSKSWLLPADECPADVMPNTMYEVVYEPDYCFQNEEGCLDKCKEGDPSSCYNLAFDLQAAEDDTMQAYSQALFLWSCKAGALSGCTNRAAEMSLENGDTPSLCSLNTYDKACIGDDPWACTMFGEHLASGTGINKDVNRAIKVLKKSCKYGIEDPACERANEILSTLNDTSDTDKDTP